MTTNETEGICYPQPHTLEDRHAVARDFVDRFKYGIRMLVDRMDNRADELYAAWPERIYVVDEKGVVAFKGGMGPFGFDPEALEAWFASKP